MVAIDKMTAGSIFSKRNGKSPNIADNKDVYVRPGSGEPTPGSNTLLMVLVRI